MIRLLVGLGCLAMLGGCPAIQGVGIGVGIAAGAVSMTANGPTAWENAQRWWDKRYLELPLQPEPIW